MEGRKLVVGGIEAAERAEKCAERSGDVRPREAHAQREEKEAEGSSQDGGEDPPGKPVELLPVPAKKEGPDEEEIERPIGKDHERDKGDLQLPACDDRGDVRPPGGEGVAGAVESDEEERAGRRADERGPPGSGAHGARFLATATEKMPHSSMACSVFSKPASRTRSSISAWVRRRMIQGRP